MQTILLLVDCMRFSKVDLPEPILPSILISMGFSYELQHFNLMITKNKTTHINMEDNTNNINGGGNMVLYPNKRFSYKGFKVAKHVVNVQVS